MSKIIGIGNEFRRDDGAGIIAIRLLQAFGVPDTLESDGTTLIEALENTESVILIDVVFSGANPGTIHRFDAGIHPLPINVFSYSTHHFSVMQAVELMRTFNQLPSHLEIYGIEGKDFSFGIGLSPKVEKAVR